ncbi:MAG: hypothetical protein ABI415_05185, partial [Flavitalea sp.]
CTYGARHAPPPVSVETLGRGRWRSLKLIACAFLRNAVNIPNKITIFTTVLEMWYFSFRDSHCNINPIIKMPIGRCTNNG